VPGDDHFRSRRWVLTRGGAGDPICPRHRRPRSEWCVFLPKTSAVGIGRFRRGWETSATEIEMNARGKGLFAYSLSSRPARDRNEIGIAEPKSAGRRRASFHGLGDDVDAGGPRRASRRSEGLEHVEDFDHVHAAGNWAAEKLTIFRPAVGSAHGFRAGRFGNWRNPPR